MIVYLSPGRKGYEGGWASLSNILVVVLGEWIKIKKDANVWGMENLLEIRPHHHIVRLTPAEKRFDERVIILLSVSSYKTSGMGGD